LRARIRPCSRAWPQRSSAGPSRRSRRIPLLLALAEQHALQRAAIVEGGELFTGRFRAKNLKFSGPSSGPGTPPAASGSFCCAFWWYFQPRSSILDPFRDSFSCPDFCGVRNPVSEGVKSPLWPPVPTHDTPDFGGPGSIFIIGLGVPGGRTRLWGVLARFHTNPSLGPRSRT
jgi:hypothetical protein